MNIWLRRVLITLFLLFWLALLLTPTLAIVLARNGQIQLGPSDGRHWRLFLLQDAEAEGLGLERGGPVAPPPDAPESVSCLRTTISYWMWTGQGQGTTYCHCAVGDTGMNPNIVPPACQLP